MKNNTVQIPPLVPVPPITLPPVTSNTSDLDPNARISELKLLLKDCSIYDVKRMSDKEKSKLSDKELYAQLKLEQNRLPAKIKCNQYNNEIATAIKHQQDLIDRKAEQKWINSP
jgi:hypothetical protein